MTATMKKGTILRFTKETTVFGMTFPQDHKWRVHKAGKDHQFLFINPKNANETFKITVNSVPSVLVPCNDPVLPLGIVSKIKHHPALSEESRAVSGYLIYEGVKVHVTCRGHGDSVEVDGYGNDYLKARELEAALKAHLIAEGFEGANDQYFSVFGHLIEYIFSPEYGLESFATQVKREHAEFQKMLAAAS